MKQFVRSIYAVALASLVAVGCSKDPSDVKIPGGIEREVQFTSNIEFPDIVKARVDGGQWTYGDQIGVYMLKKGGAINNEEDIILESSNRLFRVNDRTGAYLPSDESQAIFYPLTYDNPAADKHDFDFFAYHPYTATEQMNNFTIPVNIAENKPVLIGTGKSGWPNYQDEGVVVEPVNLNFTHKMARIKLNIEVNKEMMQDDDLNGMTVTFVRANALGEYNLLEQKFEEKPLEEALVDVPFIVTKHEPTIEEELAGIEVTGSTATLIMIPNEDYDIDYRRIVFTLKNNADPNGNTLETHPIEYPLDAGLRYEAGKEYVYNVTINRDQVSFKIETVEPWIPGPEIVADDTNTEDLATWEFRRSVYNPNSYIWASRARTATTSTQYDKFTFPIMKAFSMWEYDPFLTAPGVNIDPIPDLTLEGNEDIELIPEIIWGDNEDIANYTVQFDEERPTRLSNIIVTYEKLISLNQMATPINMLIGVKLKKGDQVEDFYRWIWHIWVVQETQNPTATTFTVRYDHDGARDGYPILDDPDGLRDYTADYVFMGRNLGAWTNGYTANDIGLFYQWGRPTPFPGPASFTYPSQSVTLYKNVDGTAVPITDGTTNGVTLMDGQISNPVDAIKNPTAFITDASGNWIDPTINDQLWNDEKKSSWDPCPEGWRVPAFSNRMHPEDMDIMLSPWNNPQIIYDVETPGDPTTTPATSTNPADYQAAFANYGYLFSPEETSTSKYRLGWYPAAGYRSGTDNAAFQSLGTEGYYWTTSFSQNGEQRFFLFDQNNVNPYGQRANSTADAAPIRCVEMIL